MIKFDSRLSRGLVALGAAAALGLGLAGAASASVRPEATGGIGSLEINPADDSGLYLDSIEGVYYGVDTPASQWLFEYQGYGTWGTGADAVTGYSYEIDYGGQCLTATYDQENPVLGPCGVNGTSWVFVDTGDGYQIWDRYGLNQRNGGEFADLLGDVSYPSSDQDEVIIFSPSELEAQGATPPFSTTWQPSVDLGF